MTANAGMSVVCERCGRAFHVKPSRLKRTSTRFCSWACRKAESSAPDRFWDCVKICGPDECWPWRAGTRVRGYGGLTFEGKPRLAHQVAFRLTRGFYAPYLRHSCDNPICCNPAHLLEGTHADNMADAVARGRRPHGEAMPGAKLTEAEVRAIRADPRSIKQVAMAYAIDTARVSRIRSRKLWKYVQ